MKKYIILSYCLVALPVQAQMFDFSGVFQPIQMSEELVNHLEKCEPYTENKSSSFMDFDIQVEYKILGKQDGNCVIEANSNAQGISSSQHCSFTDEDIAMYVPAIRHVLKNMQYTVEDSAKMMKDPKYMLAAGMMMDEEKCQFHQDAIDLTKDLRTHLKNCTPYTDKQNVGPTEFTRKIIGRQNGACAFEEEIFHEAQDLSSFLGADASPELREAVQNVPDMLIKIKCQFSDEQLREYEEILESQVIPAAASMEEALPDFENFNPRAEADFLQQHCEVSDMQK